MPCLHSYLDIPWIDGMVSVAPVNSFLILPSSPIPLLLELQIYVLR
jgi:hypothetical protein